MLDPYGALFRRVLYPGYERLIRRRPTLERLAYLERQQWRSLDELLAIQLGALRRLLDHAYAHVPFYRDRMAAAGLAPADLREPGDLLRLPLCPRSEVRAAGDRRKSLVPPLPLVTKATSGTQGEPLAFGYDWSSEHWRNAVRLRGYGWAGLRPGDRTLHYWGLQAAPISSPGRRAKVRLDRSFKRERYLNCTLRGDPDLVLAVEEIRRFRPKVILCYAQAGADLARFVNRTGARTWDSLQVICGAERLFDADRQALQQAFGPAVFETYGCREFMLIGAECDHHQGLHLSMENLIVELIVREGDRVRHAAPGELGEVVITDLHNYGMPFIRYVNGDLAIAERPDRCACGRALLRLRGVDGRVTETLRDGRGNPVSGLVFNVMFAGAMAQAVRQFQAHQHLDGSITLRLVPQGTLADDAREAIRQTCARYLEGVEVRTEVVSQLPVTRAGKRQVVVVER